MSHALSHGGPTAPADTPIGRLRVLCCPALLVDSANLLLPLPAIGAPLPPVLPRPGDPTREGLTAPSNALDSRSPRKRRAERT
jgi:hypothetical protein